MDAIDKTWFENSMKFPKRSLRDRGFRKALREDAKKASKLNPLQKLAVKAVGMTEPLTKDLPAIQKKLEDDNFNFNEVKKDIIELKNKTKKYCSPDVISFLDEISSEE